MKVGSSQPSVALCANARGETKRAVIPPNHICSPIYRIVSPRFHPSFLALV